MYLAKKSQNLTQFSRLTLAVYCAEAIGMVNKGNLELYQNNSAERFYKLGLEGLPEEKNQENVLTLKLK